MPTRRSATPKPAPATSKAPSKSAAKSAVKPATKPPAEFPAAKPAKPAKAANPAAPAAQATPPVKPTKAAAKLPKPPKPIKAPKPAKPAKPDPTSAEPKAPKQKLVRDSFTIPRAEYQRLDALKDRLVTLMRPTKKSELLRAGIRLLDSLGDDALRAAVDAVPAIKTGRPGSAKANAG